MKVVLIGIWVLVALVFAAAVLNVVPPGAVLSVLALAIGFTVSYRTHFRGPNIKLLPAPANRFENSVSAYSAGMPSNWNVTVNLVALNDGPRPGVLTRFLVDGDEVEHLPKQAQAFNVTFSNLEWKTPPHPYAVASSFPVPLALHLEPRAREKVSFRVTLSFATTDPSVLAEDLRDIRGLRVMYRYWGGTEQKQKERHGTIELSYSELRNGVRAYWSGASQFHDYVRRIDSSITMDPRGGRRRFWSRLRRLLRVRKEPR